MPNRALLLTPQREMERREASWTLNKSRRDPESREAELGSEGKLHALFCFKLSLINAATDIVFVTLPRTAVETAAETAAV